MEKKIIWTSDDYFDDAAMQAWKADFAEANGIEENEYTDEKWNSMWHEEVNDFLDCQRDNLNILVDGYIVRFADYGLWNRRERGMRMVGNNIKDILYSECEWATWYGGDEDIYCDAAHHDGTNHYLYRVVDTYEEYEELGEKLSDGQFSEEQFIAGTKSLYPYVAKVYGW